MSTAGARWLLPVALSVAFGAHGAVGAVAANLPADLRTVDTAKPGPWAVGAHEVMIPDGDASFPASVRYPVDPGSPSSAAEEGGALGVAADAPLAPGRHPAIVFGHGYLGRLPWYESTLRHLAGWGFIVVAPGSELGPFPDHAAYTEDFSLVLDWLEQEDAASDSWLSGHLDRGAYGASGHSMGGGASLAAAARDPRFRTVANLAAADLRTGVTDDIADLETPVLLVAGELDAIAPVERHQRPLFEAKRVGQAQLAIVEGGSHCGFLQPPAIADVICDRAAIDPEQQLATSHGLLTDWFLLELAGRDELRDRAWSSPPRPGVRSEALGHGE